MVNDKELNLGATES